MTRSATPWPRGEMTWAARLIERHFDAVYYWRSEGATIRRWVSALPADLARSRPRLLLVQALMTATGGDLGAVEPLLRRSGARGCRSG